MQLLSALVFSINNYALITKYHIILVIYNLKLSLFLRLMHNVCKLLKLICFALLKHKIDNESRHLNF